MQVLQMRRADLTPRESPQDAARMAGGLKGEQGLSVG